MASSPYVRWFEEIGRADVPTVGGKNASLGELFRNLGAAGVRVPAGFAITADAYRAVLQAGDLEGRMQAELDAFGNGTKSLPEVGAAVRALLTTTPIPDEVKAPILEAYAELSRRYGTEDVDVAVRSSATAEDLPDASFAGQQESYLNIRGVEGVLEAVRECMASLFTDRAISYRQAFNFDHMKVYLSVVVQKMVRSDIGAAGVLFTIDTESGFPDMILINGTWGLGEYLVKGIITPDEYRVFKPLLGDRKVKPIVQKVLGAKHRKLVYGDARNGINTTNDVETTAQERGSFVLSDEHVLELARWGVAIEKHYGCPMDVEWALDGESKQLFVVQARPETVESQKTGATLRTYTLQGTGPVLVSGAAVGAAIATGHARVLHSLDQAAGFHDGDVLVAEMTNPDWVPLMRRASAIVTDLGGRTSHAAIVSRELGVPAVIGTGDATTKIVSGTAVTVSCAEGETGRVYAGTLPFSVVDADLGHMPDTRTKIMVNFADPDAALRWWRLPCQGVGLARMEFIVNRLVKVHPMALLQPEKVTEPAVQREIAEITAGYDDKAEYFVDTLARGIARIAAARHPYNVIVRTSDFKTNEYADLVGGRAFEPSEENPMLGFRGASRYYSERYRDAFGLECRALKRVRDEMGLTNVVVMLPFVRTVAEADHCLEVMAQHGLRRGENGLKVYMMVEIPANVILADQFAKRFDGFSIGSNDLTQLTLGVDRDSADLASVFDERNEAVTTMIAMAIERAHAAGIPIGICGQGPSDYPDFAEFLVERGIDSISLNPDTVVATRRRIAAMEQQLGRSPVTAG